MTVATKINNNQNHIHSEIVVFLERMWFLCGDV